MNETRDSLELITTKSTYPSRFVCVTDKSPLEYVIGEKIQFKLFVKREEEILDVPYIFYKLTGDDGQSSEGFIKSESDRSFTVEAYGEKAGSVNLTANACDENRQPITEIEAFNGSVIINFHDIVCGTKRPEDYLDFWASLKSEAENIPLEVLYNEKIECASSPDFAMYDMRIAAPRGGYVSVAVAYPKGAKKNSLKLVMFYKGYGVRQTMPVPIEGCLTVYVNCHAIPNIESDEYFNNLKQNELKGYGFDLEENKNPDTTYWAKMFLRNFVALRYFRNHELINKKDYLFVGSSQGGMQACNMAAHSSLATGVVLNVPWLADLGGSEAFGRGKLNMPCGVGVHYFDTAIAAGELKCPVYMISGLGDRTCPPSTQVAIYNAVKSSVYHEFYQNKTHSLTIPFYSEKYAVGDMSLENAFSDVKSIYYELN